MVHYNHIHQEPVKETIESVLLLVSHFLNTGQVKVKVKPHPNAVPLTLTSLADLKFCSRLKLLWLTHQDHMVLEEDEGLEGPVKTNKFDNC